ncbi:DUF6777 domain-containing protein [Streptomyces showdoensis]|uniref:DUF6777 domain-containing protein n=1 Tax=Streptomyces showdoensis TaxID=68268 RepID=A0A2P2GH60_STREW|nr:DUF6777 domain-containing protein [Streptomyces showdoensis]KKZ70852.1 hypothetical protein VO63_26785 [Streptomyces showdoensis]
MRTPGRWPTRPGAVAAAALAAALLMAGCSSKGPGEAATEQAPAAPAREVLLQAAGAQSPDAFTPSTAQEGAPARSGTAPDGVVGTPVPAAREVGGATPGLYAGTRSVASCDVARQVALLTAEPARARSFAEAAGIPESEVAGWLRGLTPVMLRADTRVTDHGYRDGRATAFQSVLQGGTAVLVDRYGTPRVRCACGSPLRSPSAGPGAVHAGEPWPGYAPDRVVAVTPTSTVVTSLVIASLADNTWIERTAGSDGEGDRRPGVLPPCDPASCDPATAPAAPLPDGRAPQSPAQPQAPATPRSPDRGTRPAEPLPDAPSPDAPAQDTPSPDAPDVPTPDLPMPDAPHDLPPEYPSAEPPPSFEELFPNDPAAQQPETFEG